jgi:hypothetical protein
MIKPIFIIALTLLTGCGLFAQDHSKALAAADTTNFTVNRKDGWQLYNSCLTPVSADSVMIELIVQHSRDINWGQEQQVGKIKPESFFPKAGQTLVFKLLDDAWQLRVDKNGKCYLRLASGSLPDEADPVVIPVRAVYKK